MKANRIQPGPGQESVWDYPRPPRLEPVACPVRVEFGQHVIADSLRAMRILETSHPPTIYIPREDIRMEFLQSSPRSSFCEWKGVAAYFHVAVGARAAENAAWCYLRPNADYAPIAGHIAFYPGLMDACYLGDERVGVQPGDFYGGWITANIVGPFKGDPGTWGW